MRRAFLILMLIVGHFHPSYGQEMLGIVNSNYAGLNAIHMNPANMADNPIAWEVNLITLGFFLENNDVYIPGVSLLSMPKRADDAGELLLYNWRNVVRDGRTSPTNFILLDNFGGEFRPKRVYMNLFVQGPSVMVSFKRSTFAFYNAFRTNLSVRNIHWSLAKYGYESLAYPFLHFEEYSAPKFGVNIMSWMEFGFGYSTVIAEGRDFRVKAGVTAKYMLGVLGVYFLNSDISYTILEEDLTGGPLTGQFVSVDALYGHTSDDPSGISGTGFGGDIGMAYEALDNAGYYKWRFGFSVLDIGAINFETGAGAYQIKQEGIWLRIDTANPGSFNTFDSSVSQVFYGNPGESFVGNSFKMSLPTALTAQFDYSLGRYWYLNTSIVQRVAGNNSPGASRANIFAISPRYERRWWEITTPVILYEYNRIRMGTAIRIAYITVGSDKIHAWFFNHDLTGLDIYATIRFWLTKDMLHGGRDKGGRVRTAVPCYRW